MGPPFVSRTPAIENPDALIALILQIAIRFCDVPTIWQKTLGSERNGVSNTTVAAPSLPRITDPEANLLFC